MPGMITINVDDASRKHDCLIELKIDGSRHLWEGRGLFSDRKIDRSNDRYSHIAQELQSMNWVVQGEVALPELDTNVLLLNKKESWPRAHFFIFKLIRLNGRHVPQDPHLNREMIAKIIRHHHWKWLTIPRSFTSFQRGWNFVKDNNSEGLVLKDIHGNYYKCKSMNEVKVPILRHVEGKTKGAFEISFNGIVSRVTARAVRYVKAYYDLIKNGKPVWAEIEYPYLTPLGSPFQPKLLRLGTRSQLAIDPAA